MSNPRYNYVEKEVSEEVYRERVLAYRKQVELAIKARLEAKTDEEIFEADDWVMQAYQGVPSRMEGDYVEVKPGEEGYESARFSVEVFFNPAIYKEMK